MATFNLEWFGLGGSMNGLPENETRDQALKDLIQNFIMPVDVISFQEVVDVKRLPAILPTGWICESYTHFNTKHQHVVLCASEKFSFENVSYDDNDTIETVAIEPYRSRPAVRSNLVDRISREIIMTVVGVHLKAFPQEGEKRKYQAKMISQDLAMNDPNIPLVILGDFNTYPTDPKSPKSVGYAADAISDIEGSLNDSLTGVRHVTHDSQFTYRKKSTTGQFDHVFIAGPIKPVGKSKTFPVCDNPNGEGVYNIKYYNQNISDHCPVVVELKLL